MTTQQHAPTRDITIGGDLTVRRLGYGAMRITGEGIWGPPKDHDAAIALLRHIVASGVNFIDTADSYGPNVSEELIAEALHPYREDLVIATKAGLVRTGPNAWPIDARPERIKECCDASLGRLKVDCIDLFQLHRIDPKVPVAETLGAFTELQKAGKIRHIGISQTTVEEYRACAKLAPIVSVQNSYNVGDRTYDDVVDACEADGVAFLPWYPLGGDGNPKHDELDRIAKARGVSANQIALAWLLARSPMMVPIPGTSSIAHFDDNMAAEALVLTSDERAALA
jgi:aryl-alcohol dehydrogenase-like predicted oxidoreductase